MEQRLKIHLIAICGMGMGPLAILLKEKGYEISGSDQNIYPPMSDQLAQWGIPVKRGYSPENLNPAPDLVVIGNAVSRNHPEVEATRTRNIPYLSMPEALDRFFLKDRTPLVVAGTHGKTTATALLTWLLERTGQKPGYLVGGILKNFNRASGAGGGKYFVVEGDEYDSAFFDKGPKFLHYHPEYLILNPIEFDHADIYRDLPHLMTSFEKLIEMMPKHGVVIAHAANANARSLLSRIPCRTVTFGIGFDADFSATDIRLEEESRFRLMVRGKKSLELASPLIGRHNVENLLAVVALLFELGIGVEPIPAALAEFQGIRRRQEILGTFRGVTLVDDFAHHPTAVRETLAALRTRYPRARIHAIFEPRSQTTRRKVFQTDFASAFGAADRVIFGPVYQPEKIPPEERLDPEAIVADLARQNKEAAALPSVEAIAESVGLEARSGDVVCLMSNGSFGGLAAKLATRLQGGP